MSAERVTRLSKKELKAPDAFQAAGAQAQSWMMTHQRGVLLGVGAALLALLVLGLIQWGAKRGETQAAKSLGDALRPLDRPVEAPSPEANVPANPESYPTQAAKDAAAERSLSAVVSSEGTTRAGITARLPLAQAQFRQGKTDPALEQFDAFLKSAPKDEPLRALAQEGRGYVFEKKGQLDQALAAFEEQAREPGEFMPGMGDFHRGRILDAQGKKEQAASVFSAVATSRPGTAAARMSEERLAALSAAGVVIPAAATGKDAGL